MRIVRSLRARGHAVGFLGDGINDAGALREADVGVSVDSAVDIAKESADIILLEKSLMVLEEGVVEGRKTFGNTIKYIKMTASSNFGNVFSVLIASAFLPFLPMLPVQLLTVNLLVRLLANGDSVGRHGPRVHPRPSAMAGRRHRAVHDLHRADQLDLRHRHLPPHVVHLRREHAGATVAVSIGMVHRIAGDADAHRPHDSNGQSAIRAEPSDDAGPDDDRFDHRSCGMLLPFVSLGGKLGLVPLPAMYFAWLAVILASYSVLTQIVKGWYIRRFGSWL